MPNDKSISQLISKSMRGELNSEESAAVEQNVNENDEARKFAELSQQIQSSLAGLDFEDTSDDQDFRLSDPCRKRLEDSVNEAIRERMTMSDTGRGNDTDPVSDATAVDQKKEGDEQEVVSRFQRIRKLGTGGIGEVWLARDEKLNRKVAIKELNVRAREKPAAWDRFQREAEITGHLEHPNIVPLYVYGNDRGSAEPFYTMRFVGKRNLLDAIEEYHDRVKAEQQDPLALHRLLSIFLDVCHAIAYAHSRGVIHRDLKPENIAIDNFGQVIVLDWGLAKVLEDGEVALKTTDSARLTDSSLMQTVEGQVIGTPMYMAPEQAAGKIDKIDKRTDVYGLGAILFSILTGEAPHTRTANESDTNITEFLDQVAASEPLRPSELVSYAPAALDSICAQAMSNKSHLRFESVQELAEAVETWIAGQSNKQAEYETLRMEGRELRADMRNRVRDLERNVRFCSGLPPIGELINAAAGEDVTAWRKRLGSIFEGLLSANPDYQSIVYGRVDGEDFSEIVRVEKDCSDTFSVRSVPKSRLNSGKVNDYLRYVLDSKPGSIHTSLDCNPSFTERYCLSKVGLLAGIPVFDDRTEDIFGFVIIGCNIANIMRQQLSRRHTAGEIVVACDVYDIMAHAVDGQFAPDALAKPVAEASPHFLPAIEHLQTNLDFVDSDSEIYGARLWFIPDQHGIMYLLRR